MLGKRHYTLSNLLDYTIGTWHINMFLCFLMICGRWVIQTHIFPFNDCDCDCSVAEMLRLRHDSQNFQVVKTVAVSGIVTAQYNQNCGDTVGCGVSLSKLKKFIPNRLYFRICISLEPANFKEFCRHSHRHMSEEGKVLSKRLWLA